MLTNIGASNLFVGDNFLVLSGGRGKDILETQKHLKRPLKPWTDFKSTLYWKQMDRREEKGLPLPRSPCSRDAYQALMESTKSSRMAANSRSYSWHRLSCSSWAGTKKKLFVMFIISWNKKKVVCHVHHQLKQKKSCLSCSSWAGTRKSFDNFKHVRFFNWVQ